MVVGMTVSIDGYVADRNGNVGRLYPDLADLQGRDDMNTSVDPAGPPGFAPARAG
jgi:hypothetical protein